LYATVSSRVSPVEPLGLGIGEAFPGFADVSEPSAVCRAPAFTAAAIFPEAFLSGGCALNEAEAKVSGWCVNRAAEFSVCTICARSPMLFVAKLTKTATGAVCERLAVAAGTNPGKGAAETASGLVALMDRAGRELRADSVSGSVAVFFSSVLAEAGFATTEAGSAAKTSV
jgi:hypothetical protein